MEEIDIWRAAKLIIDQFPEDPVLEAAQRADAAYELGDMFNFDVWTRVTSAVNDLLRTMRSPDEPLN
jgi:hypothetical protein